jgi:hypothetical protein
MKGVINPKLVGHIYQLRNTTSTLSNTHIEKKFIFRGSGSVFCWAPVRPSTTRCAKHTISADTSVSGLLETLVIDLHCYLDKVWDPLLETVKLGGTG